MFTEWSGVAISRLLDGIVEDPNIPRRLELPNLTTFQGRSLLAPMIFVLGGGSWPTSSESHYLHEVSSCFFPVKPGGSSTSNLNSQEAASDAGPIVDSSGVQEIQATRFNWVGTAFFIERYRMFIGKHADSYTSAEAGCSKAMGSVFVVRVGIDSGRPVADQKTLSRRETLWHTFFNTFKPLLFDSALRSEACEGSLLFGVSQSDIESGQGLSGSQSSDSSNEDPRSSLTYCNRRKEPLLDYTATPAVEMQLDSCSSREVLPNLCDLQSCSRDQSTSKGFELRIATVCSLLKQEGHHNEDVQKGWSYFGWCHVAKRRAIVELIDRTVTCANGSRAATHVALSYLDAYVSVKKDINKGNSFFYGIIHACAVLGCKQVDHLAHTCKLMQYLRTSCGISRNELVRFELEVLTKLDFRLQQLTTLEVVETLLHLCGGADIEEALEVRGRMRELSRWGKGAARDGGLSNDDSSTSLKGIREWVRLCDSARLLNDIVIREAKSITFRPSVLGVAIVVAAARRLSYRLPQPLLELAFAELGTDASTDDGPTVDDSSLRLLSEFAERMRRRFNRSPYCELNEEMVAGLDFVEECLQPCDVCNLSGVLLQRYIHILNP